MRQDTAIILTKGIAYTLIGLFSPWTAALAQWANSGEWPSKIVWIGIIFPLSIVGGATQLLAFLSGSYTDYLKAKAPLKAIEDAAEADRKRQAAESDTQILSIRSAAKVEAIKTEVEKEKDKT